jgi:hypothetical protein
MSKFSRFLVGGLALKTGINIAARGLQAAQKPWFAAFGLGTVPAWAWPLAIVGIAIQVGSVAYMYYTAAGGKTDSPETNTDEVQGQ